MLEKALGREWKTAPWWGPCEGSWLRCRKGDEEDYASIYIYIYMCVCVCVRVCVCVYLCMYVCISVHASSPWMPLIFQRTDKQIPSVWLVLLTFSDHKLIIFSSISMKMHISFLRQTSNGYKSAMHAHEDEDEGDPKIARDWEEKHRQYRVLERRLHFRDRSKRVVRFSPALVMDRLLFLSK